MFIINAIKEGKHYLVIIKTLIFIILVKLNAHIKILLGTRYFNLPHFGSAIREINIPNLVHV